MVMYSFIRSSAAAIGLFVIMCLPALAAPLVMTEKGELSGISQGAVLAFLGIPYAQPPVGDKRWRPPVAMESWGGLRDAHAFGPSCYQPDPPLFGPYTHEFVDTPPPSEDCLYLNVWAPQERSEHRPVMVWLHGGGFIGGSGAVPIYNGADLAAKGMVVVTINYRLGPFGFLAHPSLSKESGHDVSGNYGLLDQIAAL